MSGFGIASTYDAINTVIFASAGGSYRLRRAFVSFLDVGSGDRVLELGCGTGQVTAALLATGADVVAVDRLPAMLEAARRRAPAARFVLADITSSGVDGGFDAVVLSFVLHSFDRDARRALLRSSHSLLVPGGWVGVLDWSAPKGRVRAAAWRRFVRHLEPSSTARDVVEGALREDFTEAGITLERARSAAGGRAEMFVLRALSGHKRGEGLAVSRWE